MPAPASPRTRQRSVLTCQPFCAQSCPRSRASWRYDILRGVSGSVRTTYLVALLVASCTPAWGQARLELVDGTDSVGMATHHWHAILRSRLTDSAYAAIRHVERPFTPDEHGWYDLIRGSLPRWESEIDDLSSLYDPAAPPPHVLIVAGNRGASDAFVHDARTIGFDLSALLSEYGSARLAANADRIDRLFRHEYSHLMQKAWLATAPWTPDTPLETAILDMWLEGLATWYSFSEPWRATRAGHSPRALDALAEMEPRLIVRLAALTCAAPDHAPRLMADLSQGPFPQKWGSLPAALWLELDAARSPRPADALRPFIQAGPDAVWDLALRHLRPELRPLLREIRQTHQLC